MSSGNQAVPFSAMADPRAWWSIGSEPFDTMMTASWGTPCRTMLETQKIMSEALIREFDVIGSAQDGCRKEFSDVLSCRTPQGLPAAYAGLAAALFRAMATQAEVNAAYARRLQQCLNNLIEADTAT